MFGTIGLPELLVIFIVILLLFGAKRIPEIARSFGQGIREFKKSAKEVKNELEAEVPSEENNKPDDEFESPAG